MSCLFQARLHFNAMLTSKPYHVQPAANAGSNGRGWSGAWPADWSSGWSQERRGWPNPDSPSGRDSRGTRWHRHSRWGVEAQNREVQDNSASAWFPYNDDDGLPPTGTGGDEPRSFDNPLSAREMAQEVNGDIHDVASSSDGW